MYMTARDLQCSPQGVREICTEMGVQQMKKGGAINGLREPCNTLLYKKKRKKRKKKKRKKIFY